MSSARPASYCRPNHQISRALFRPTIRPPFHAPNPPTHPPPRRTSSASPPLPPAPRRAALGDLRSYNCKNSADLRPLLCCTRLKSGNLGGDNKVTDLRPLRLLIRRRDTLYIPDRLKPQLERLREADF